MQIHEHQIEALRNRLEKVEASMARRTAARDLIVNDRVADLLGEGAGLQWDANPLSAALTVSTPEGMVRMPVNSLPVPAVPATVRTKSLASTVTAAPAAAASYDATTELQRNTGVDSRRSPYAGSLQAAAQEVESSLAVLRSFQRTHGSKHPGSQQAIELLEHQRESLVHQLKLMEIDIREAELLLRAAESKLEGAHQIQRSAPMSVPRTQLETLELEVQLAKLRLERLQVQREPYQKLLDESEAISKEPTPK
jgi:hypothetical protein